jgi:hypothetical protein
MRRAAGMSPSLQAAIVSVAEEGNEPVFASPGDGGPFAMLQRWIRRQRRNVTGRGIVGAGSGPSSNSVVACSPLATTAAYISHIAPAAVGEASAKLRLSQRP